jgi:hypothetical protein
LGEEGGEKISCIIAQLATLCEKMRRTTLAKFQCFLFFFFFFFLLVVALRSIILGFASRSLFSLCACEMS